MKIYDLKKEVKRLSSRIEELNEKLKEKDEEINRLNNEADLYYKNWEESVKISRYNNLMLERYRLIDMGIEKSNIAINLLDKEIENMRNIIEQKYK